MKKRMLIIVIAFVVASPISAQEYLGRLTSNPFCADCTANPWAPINNRFNPNNPRNEFGPYGNRFSPYSANNPFATQTPAIYESAPDYVQYGSGSEANAESDAFMRRMEAETHAELACEDARINAELGLE